MACINSKNVKKNVYTQLRFFIQSEGMHKTMDRNTFTKCILKIKSVLTASELTAKYLVCPFGHSEMLQPMSVMKVDCYYLPEKALKYPKYKLSQRRSMNWYGKFQFCQLVPNTLKLVPDCSAGAMFYNLKTSSFVYLKLFI